MVWSFVKSLKVALTIPVEQLRGSGRHPVVHRYHCPSIQGLEWCETCSGQCFEHHGNRPSDTEVGGDSFMLAHVIRVDAKAIGDLHGDDAVFSVQLDMEDT